ncbi:ABC transporter substrate-binding protein [Arcanobacterium hippocoleae]
MKFSDGSPLTAKNFVDSWNYMANPKNAQAQGYFLEDVKGYTSEENADVPELTGLKVVDDQTFTVELSKSVADFPLRLGYSAFAPLPEKAFENLEAFGEAPVSSGPYMVAENGWEHNVSIKLVKNPEYSGPREAKNGGIDFKIYNSQDAAYADLLAGNLDVLDAVPDSAFESYEADLGDRAINQAAAIFQSFSIDVNAPHFGMNEEGKLRRAALSMAIDREEITKTIFQETRTPATDFTSPVIDGYTDSLTGNEVLKFDAAKAKEYWEKANAISPWEGEFSIAYNSDGGHQAWVDAVTNQIKNTLGIEAIGNPYPDFKSVRDDISNHKLMSGFRTGWQADYPGLFNFLGPLYAKGAPSNDGQYDNPEFDQLLAAGNAASSVEEANKSFVKAQEILLQDLPAIPLWYSNVNGGYGEAVKNVKFGWDSQPLYYLIEK